MATVVNSGELLKKFTTLGWTSSANDLLAAALSSGIPAAVVGSYLDALVASPGALNDQTISGVTAAQGTAITTFLKNRNLVGV